MDQKDGITSQLSELNRETSEEAKKRFARGERFLLLSLLFLPALVFLREFIWKRRFFQGTSGMVESLLLAYRHFLIQGKLWELKARPDKVYENWKQG
jgi:hypothetical protein